MVHKVHCSKAHNMTCCNRPPFSDRVSKLLILAITLQSAIVVIMVVCSFHPLLPLLLRNTEINERKTANLLQDEAQNEVYLKRDKRTNYTGKEDVRKRTSEVPVLKTNDELDSDSVSNDSDTLPLQQTIVKDTGYTIIEKIGIILGTGAVVQLFAGVVQAMIIHWIGVASLLILTSFACSASPIISAVTTSFGWICTSEALACFATFAGFGSYYYIMNLIASNERERIRYVNILSIFNGIGIAITYMTGSSAYQFLGHTITYAIYIVCAVSTTLCWCVCIIFTKQYLKERELAMDGEVKHVDNDNSSKSKKQLLAQLKFIKDPYVALSSFQLCAIYICMGTLWATAPNYLISELGLEQWEMGVVMGAATVLEIVTILACTVFVVDHKRRIKVMAFFYLWQIAGYLFYPFAKDFWQVLIAETLIRAARANHASLYSTLLAYIVDVRRIGDYKIAVSSFMAPIAVGIVIGNYSAALLTELLTFKWLYITLGAISALTSITFLPFRHLKPTSPLPCTHQIMLKESELNGDELHLSKISLGPVI